MLRLEIKNKKELERFVKDLESANQKALRQAARRATNEANKEAWKITHQRYPLMPKNADDGKTQSYQSRSRMWTSTTEDSVTGFLAMDSRPYSLIHSVVGSRQPQNQKGIPVTKWRRIFYWVDKSRHRLPPGMFIASPHKTRGAGVTQVFTRGDKQSGEHGEGLMKATNISLSRLFSLKDKQEKMIDRVAKMFERAYTESIDRDLKQ